MVNKEPSTGVNIAVSRNREIQHRSPTNQLFALELELGSWPFCRHSPPAVRQGATLRARSAGAGRVAVSLHVRHPGYTAFWRVLLFLPLAVRTFEQRLLTRIRTQPPRERRPAISCFSRTRVSHFLLFRAFPFCPLLSPPLGRNHGTPASAGCRRRRRLVFRGWKKQQ